MNTIYEYDDFRLFLKDHYDQKVAADQSYTCRKFAAEAGFSNPGFLNDVVKGRRKLSREAAGKMIAGFGLNPGEAEFFRLLVGYHQARDPARRQEFYRQIVFRRNRSAFSKLNPALSRYYQDYRYPLVRSAIMVADFRGDYESLGHFVVPPIPAAMVKKYVRDLCEWGLVTQGVDGRYRVTSEFVEPPSTLRDLVKQINREWIVQSLDALHRLPPEKRHISTMLCAVSRQTRDRITEKVEKFREEVWAMVQQDQEQADRIVQLNIQFFPKSRAKD